MVLLRRTLWRLLTTGANLWLGMLWGKMPIQIWRLGPGGEAKQTLKRLGQKVKDTIIQHDQDGVYIGHRWLYQVMVKDEARVSYSEHGARGNVYMESFIGRFKVENRLLFWEQEDLRSLEKIVNSRVRYYNQSRRHSALGNKSPLKYLREKGKLSS
ncbi:MAG: integrase core domain-containing protein [Candidatus Helarchaeota archaeon]